MGLILAWVMSSPIAKYLFTRNKLQTGCHSDIDVGVTHDEQEETEIDYLAVLYAWLWLNLTLIGDYLVNTGINAMGL